MNVWPIQPLGIFDYPASHLLLPHTEDPLAQSACELLMRGQIPEQAPADWGFFLAAAAGDSATAFSRISQQGDDGVLSYNRWVLAPDVDQLTDLLQTTGDHSAPLAALLPLAAYAAGLVDQLPDNTPLEAEYLALSEATRAAAQLEQGNLPAAQEHLKSAIAAVRAVSPVFAASLLAQLGDVQQEMGGIPPAIIMQNYRDGIQLLQDISSPTLLAELNIKLGMLLQHLAGNSRSALLQAVTCYQSALQGGITQEEHPDLFATLQNNLGLAYLSMPAGETSNHLRTGIAVQSFRHALKIYQRESRPEMWATVSMNLANAFQYAPSSHPEENLIQAVKTYDEVLEVRTRERDPVAYANVLANQANALAHLGMFKPALEKISEAYKLFQWYDQPEQAVAARELVQQINTCLEDHHAIAQTGEKDLDSPSAALFQRGENQTLPTPGNA